MSASGLAAGLAYGGSTGRVGSEAPRALAGALVQLPAIWLLAALTVAGYGLLPRLAPAVGWGALAGCLLLGQVGALLQVSSWLLDLSPFAHVPQLPGGSVSAAPLLVLVTGAAALVAAGLLAFRWRDVPAT
jgi:ABC-2 type transport system permease protein